LIDITKSGSRRECLDHVIVFSETHLRRVLSCYFITGPARICR
jgi:hypothetical protein